MYAMRAAPARGTLRRQWAGGGKPRCGWARSNADGAARVGQMGRGADGSGVLRLGRKLAAMQLGEHVVLFSNEP